MRKILKASAGTGKTYRLSLEFVAALLEGQSFEEIVVMTFTRKATAEIRERIIEHLEELLQQGDGSEVRQSLNKVYPDLKLNHTLLQQAYANMLKNKDKLNIYTIDSFVNRIFKQAIAPYLGIYRYEIVEDDDNQEIVEKVFKKVLDNPEDFALMERFLTDNPERKIKNYLDLIEGMLKNRWKFLLIGHKPREKRETGELYPLLDEAIRFLEDIVKAKGKNFSPDFLVSDFKTLIPEYLRLQSIEDKEDFILKHRKSFIQDTFWHGGKVRGKKVADLKEGMEAKYQEFRGKLAAYIYNQEMIPYEKEIIKFSTRIFEIYDGIKFKERAFTHSDISNYTYKYLKEETLNLLDGKKVSDYFFELLGSEVKTLFIDEFQDTSILQWKILKPLIDRCENIITVGDEKQSIYGWRGGEKELFARLDKILGGEDESLNMCYRSEKEIINFVNNFFTGLGTDWEYKKVDHLPEKDGGYVEVLLGGEKLLTNTDTKTFRRLSEERQQKMIELNERITPNLKQEIAHRIKELPDYGDVGILARSNNDLSEIATELDKEGIPYLLESKDSLLDHEAVKPLYFLLNYLTYHDYLYLLKFLRSDLAGISNQELKYLLHYKNEVKDFMEDKKEFLAEESLQKVLKEIKSFQELRYKELTNYLIEMSGVMERYRDNSGALKNIYQFFKLMRRFPCLKEFMAYVDEKRDSEELKQVGVKEENAVKLMTIHKSKGLSFETEFFYWKPSNGGGGGPGSMELFISFDDKFDEVKDYLLTHSRYTKLFEYLGYDFNEEKKEKELVEEINNVYVAMTRPERNLFLYVEGPCKLKPHKPGENWSNSNSYGFFEPALLKGAGVDSLCDLVERKIMGSLYTERETKEMEDVDLPELRPYFCPEEIPDEEIERINHNKEFGMNLDLEIKKIEGLAIHYYLEHIRYNTEEEREYGRKMVLARFGNVLGPARVEELNKRVEDFIDENPEYFAPRWQVFTEYELHEGDDLYRIDRLLVDKEEEEILILDFKSGETMEESQLEQYIRLVEDITDGEYKIRGEFVEL